jgi:hypothetical protein
MVNQLKHLKVPLKVYILMHYQNCLKYYTFSGIFQTASNALWI